MSWSRATLKVVACEGETRVVRAAAKAPQRWSLARRGEWAEATHQLLGDGAFAHDTLATTIDLGRDARLVVRGVAATPLRRGNSAWCMRVRVAAGGTFMLLPGALIPHEGSAHGQSLAIDVSPGGRALVASIVCTGRARMSEEGAFESLRLRTRAHVDGALAFAEDVSLAPSELSLSNRGSFGRSQVAISMLVLGAWDSSALHWWTEIAGGRRTGGATMLRSGGAAYRAVVANLGEALCLLEDVEAAARDADANCSPSC